MEISRRVTCLITRLVARENYASASTAAAAGALERRRAETLLVCSAWSLCSSALARWRGLRAVSQSFDALSHYVHLWHVSLMPSAARSAARTAPLGCSSSTQRTETDGDGRRRTDGDGRRRTETDGRRRTETDAAVGRARSAQTGTDCTERTAPRLRPTLCSGLNEELTGRSARTGACMHRSPHVGEG